MPDGGLLYYSIFGLLFVALLATLYIVRRNQNQE
jgi:hypothetical protein